MEHQWNEPEGAKRKYSGKNLSQYHFVQVEEPGGMINVQEEGGHNSKNLAQKFKKIY
jgi:hypothetical protein